ncbi:hypothetical protein QUV93_01695 [Phascolarctobacterium faecium]|nr:hypothetical protein [Phascolarctobacterium faecium]MDM8108582.1 hypothetical protein [Phascolarctobacterium faecium]
MAGKNKPAKRGSSADLADILMITTRRVNQLVDEEVLAREPEGDFILPTAVAAYYEYKYADKDETTYLTEKARHEKAKRELAELELQKRRNEVHDAADVELVMTDMLTNLRNQLLGLPSKMAPQLANRDKDYIDQALTDEIQSRLTELSDYSPDMFVEGDSNASEDN